VTAEDRDRDALARIAATELGGVSLDEALRVVVFEHQSHLAWPGFALIGTPRLTDRSSAAQPAV
jgi:hypothetical protein